MSMLINLLLSMLFYCDGSLAVGPLKPPVPVFGIPRGESPCRVSRHAHYRDPAAPKPPGQKLPK